MEHQLSVDSQKHLDRFCRQYLQFYLYLDYPDDQYLRNEAFQETIYNTLFKEGSLPHPPPLIYQVRVLKELLRRIEASIQNWDEEGLSDNLYNAFSVLITSSIPSEVTAVQQKSYVTYSLSSLSSQNPATITLHEARNLLSGSGTTGSRTWEAALHFGNYLISNPSLVNGKSVLELGAGTGYLSILCAKHLNAAKVLATDGSEDVVETLQTNIYLNDLQDKSLIQGKELKWGHALLGGEEQAWNGGQKIDVVLGADLTYEASGIPALLVTLGDLMDMFPSIKIIIAPTVRNQETFEIFLKTCQAYKYLAEEIEFPLKATHLQEGPFYDDNIPIKLFSISKS
ncbi:hypothetical protein HYFRA_00000431 [Hymenoscyphus fraxineus]|uniref:Protein-lysine N-methyltransferase EFM3 n=1 Tax=Hymenoscyphus fraxineus TaxID=746836 RepID=A0A9N9PXX0_9HELO|nr:hypothetical protein HYFRA_00000431 [Hymenoscyphus fraxineus]